MDVRNNILLGTSAVNGIPMGAYRHSIFVLTQDIQLTLEVSPIAYEVPTAA